MNWMDIINVPMGYVLRFSNMIFGNQYLFALLLFAIIVEIILLPFGIKQQKNSIKQAGLRPKEMAIRKKYAGRDDKPTQQKMSMEIQELYQKEGYNPMGGCLPMLIQFPIIIALYYVVINPLKYISRLGDDVIHQLSIVANLETSSRGVSSIGDNLELVGKIQEMGYEAFASVEGFSLEIFNALPDMSVFGGLNGFLDLSAIPGFTGDALKLIWVPILTFAAYFFSMKMSRKLSYQPATTDQAMGCSNWMMDLMMPLFSVYIAFQVPAALGVYWIFKSLIGVGKQAILHVAMPLPKCTEEDIKAAEKELNARQDKSTNVVKSGKIVRSLHHIDDEDFEDTAPAARARREAMEAAQREEEAKRAEAAEQGLFKFAPFKKDKPADSRKGKKDKKKGKGEEDTDAVQESKDIETDTNGEEK